MSSRIRQFIESARIATANFIESYINIPTITTTQRNALSPTAGMTIMNSTTGSLEFYDGENWIATNLIPTVNSVTGTIYSGVSSTLTLNVTNATDTIIVRFSEGGIVLVDVEDVIVTSGSYSVAVPAAAYGQTAGDTITVSILNQDGTPSSNGISKTVVGLPTGGTITTYGDYRIHTFTTSSSFVVPSGLTLSDVEYLVIAGGGRGGNNSSYAAVSGTTNTGSGGGGSDYRTAVSVTPGSGGSGIVIIRYQL